MIEIVNGTVIGQKTFPYQFWTTRDNPKKILPERAGHLWFQSDKEAIDWLKREHPDWYATGVEMRAY